MSAPTRDGGWTAANQRLVTAELARIALRLGEGADAGEAARAAAAVAEARAAMPAPAAVDVVAERFGLSAFERDTLLLCAGVELDARLAALVDAQGGPTLGLALAALEGAHWSAAAPVRPLRRWRLVELDESQGLARARLRVDERILHCLAGVDYLDRRLTSLVRPAPPAPPIALDATRALAERIVERIAERTTAAAPREAGAPGVVALAGDDAAGQADVAWAAAGALGRVLWVLRAEDVPAGHAELEALATLWAREAALLGAALLIDCHADGATRAAARLAEMVAETLAELPDGPAGAAPVFIAAPSALPLAPGAAGSVAWHAVDRPDPASQKRLWRAALGDGAGALNGALDAVAGHFRLSARGIHAEGARLRAALGASADPGRLVWSAVRETSRSRLDELAQRIEARAEWDDLVLPEAQCAALRAIAAQVRHRLTVYEGWGFGGASARGLGIGALFAGESGTGKTMAAEVIARELDLDLYRIDLSSVVSKYIGETEKNLRRVFAAAEESGAILLFDEADALFGKRSEVRDSHDRYANIEVSYLLQRMESYRGLAILTSNLRAALDPAFQRRLRFIVQFPFPDEALREAIWRRAFPTEAPREALDYGRLSRLTVSGGSIRNIALGAAFAAAAAGRAIGMADLLRAAHQDALKRERPLSDAETRGWA